MIKKLDKDTAGPGGTKQPIQEGELLYQGLYGNAPVAYFSISADDGSVLRCNSAALNLLGYDRETLIGKKVLDLYAETPDGRAKAKEIYHRFKSGEPIRGAELQIKHVNGQPIWVSLFVEPVKDNNGKVLNSISMVIDITERKRAEKELERRNRELSSLNIVATTISKSLVLEEVLAATLKTVLDLMELKSGWILLRDSWTDKLVLASHIGMTEKFVQEETKEPLGDCIGLHVMQRKETLIAENLLECPRLSRSLVKGEKMACHASAPLISKDEVVGVMNLACKEFQSFSERDLDFLTAVGRQVGVAIENARLFEDIKEKSIKLKKAYEQLKAEREKTKSLKKALDDKFGLQNIIGKNHKMKAIYDLIEDISKSDSAVLIQGESGTGKELIARAIHLLSSRRDKPFVVANCSAYAESLLESELFGHEKGAFTGAIRMKKGRFELAGGGTIFLDEIGEIPSVTQLLLLRVLQEKNFERVGGEETIQVDVRVIAATNRNLNKEMMGGRFREDLYYRLNVIPLMAPPLRDRKDDIPLLSDHFLEIYSKANRKNITGFSGGVMQIFMEHDWPGNVRELQNAVEHAVILAKGDMIKEIDLPLNLKEKFKRAEIDTFSLKDTEKDLILRVLEDTNGNKYQAAKKLGITRSTLYGKMKKHGIP
jgi:two-component system response regulator HydG